jgi:hypothetical protein
VLPGHILDRTVDQLEQEKFGHRSGAFRIQVVPIIALGGGDIPIAMRTKISFGTEKDFDEFAAQLRTRGMGWVMDVVPNHMCIAGAGNKWWSDVLENGPGSPFAS